MSSFLTVLRQQVLHWTWSFHSSWLFPRWSVAWQNHLHRRPFGSNHWLSVLSLSSLPLVRWHCYHRVHSDLWEKWTDSFLLWGCLSWNSQIPHWGVSGFHLRVFHFCLQRLYLPFRDIARPPEVDGVWYKINKPSWPVLFRVKLVEVFRIPQQVSKTDLMVPDVQRNGLENSLV